MRNIKVTVWDKLKAMGPDAVAIYCDLEAAEILAEVERLRERAEHAERERDALIEMCIVPPGVILPPTWDVFTPDCLVGCFASHAEAVEVVRRRAGLDALPAGEGEARRASAERSEAVRERLEIDTDEDDTH